MIYELSEWGGLATHLCHRVRGFRGLWWEYLETINFTYGAFSPSLEIVVGDIPASDIREEILDLLPCSMTVQELSNIIDKHLNTEVCNG